MKLNPELESLMNKRVKELKLKKLDFIEFAIQNLLLMTKDGKLPDASSIQQFNWNKK